MVAAYSNYVPAFTSSNYPFCSSNWSLLYFKVRLMAVFATKNITTGEKRLKPLMMGFWVWILNYNVNRIDANVVAPIVSRSVTVEQAHHAFCRLKWSACMEKNPLEVCFFGYPCVLMYLHTLSVGITIKQLALFVCFFIGGNVWSVLVKENHKRYIQRCKKNLFDLATTAIPHASTTRDWNWGYIAGTAQCWQDSLSRWKLPGNGQMLHIHLGLLCSLVKIV